MEKIDAEGYTDAHNERSPTLDRHENIGTYIPRDCDSLEDCVRKSGALPRIQSNEDVPQFGPRLFGSLGASYRQGAINWLERRLNTMGLSRDEIKKVKDAKKKKVDWMKLTSLYEIFVAKQPVMVAAQKQEAEGPIMAPAVKIQILPSAQIKMVEPRREDKILKMKRIKQVEAKGRGEWLDIKFYKEVGVHNKTCTFCNFGGGYDICKTCKEVVDTVENMPGFDARRIKSRTQYVRKWYRLGRNDEKFAEWFAKKKPWSAEALLHNIQRQEKKDFDLNKIVDIEDCVQEMTRAQARMAEYNAKMKMEFETAHKQGAASDISDLAMSWLKSIADFLSSKHGWIAGASVVLGIACVALFTWLLTVKTKTDVGWWLKTLGILALFVGSFTFGALASALFTDAMILFKLRQGAENDGPMSLSEERSALKYAPKKLKKEEMKIREENNERLLLLLTEDEKNGKTRSETLALAREKERKILLESARIKREKEKEDIEAKVLSEDASAAWRKIQEEEVKKAARRTDVVERLKKLKGKEKEEKEDEDVPELLNDDSDEEDAPNISKRDSKILYQKNPFPDSESDDEEMNEWMNEIAELQGSVMEIKDGVKKIKQKMNEQPSGPEAMKDIKRIWNEYRKENPERRLSNDYSGFFLQALMIFDSEHLMDFDRPDGDDDVEHARAWIYGVSLMTFFVKWRKERFEKKHSRSFWNYCYSHNFDVDYDNYWHWVGPVGFDEDGWVAEMADQFGETNASSLTDRHYSFYINEMRQRTGFEEQPAKKQGLEEDEILTGLFKKLVEGAGKALTDKEYTMDVSKTFTSSLTGISHLLRNGKTIVDVLGPLAEKVTSSVYELVTGDAYVAPEDRLVLEKINPLMEEARVLEDIPDIGQRMSREESLLKQVEELKVKFDEVENLLMKMKTPPRYSVPFTIAKKMVDDWNMQAQDARFRGLGKSDGTWVSVHGPSGAGKSSFQDVYSQDVYEAIADRGKLVGMGIDGPWNKSKIYTRRKENEYWDSYKGEFVTVVDDLFQETDPMMRRLAALELIWMVNPASYQLHMSKLLDKGKVYFTSKLILTSSNDTLNPTDLGITAPEALFRRRDMILFLRAREGRKLCTKDDPEYRKGWHIDLHDSFGNLLMEDMPYEAAVAMAVRLIETRSLEASVETPKLEKLDVDAHEGLLSKLITSNRTSLAKVATGQSGEAELNSAAPAKGTNPQMGKYRPGKGRPRGNDYQKRWDPRFAKKQGSVSGKDGEKFLEEKADTIARYEEMVDFARDGIRRGDEEAMDDAFWESLNHSEAVFDREKVMKWFESLKGYIKIQRLQEALIRAKKHIVAKVHEVKEMTLAAWDDVLLVSTKYLVPGSLKMIWGSMKRWTWRTFTQLKKWAEEHWWQVLTGLAVVTGLIAGGFGIAKLVEYVREKKDKPEKQGYDEAARARAAEREEARLREKEDKANMKAEMARMRSEQRSGQRSQETQDPRYQVRMTDNITLDAIETNLYDSHTYTSQGVEYKGTVFFVGGRVAVTAAHVANWMYKHPDGYSELLQGKNGKRVNFHVSNKDVKMVRIPCTEAALVLYPRFVKTHRNRMHHFLLDSDTENKQMHTIADINCVCRSVNSELNTRSVPYADITTTDPYLKDDHGIYWCADGNVLGTEDGDSGALWFTSNTKLARRLIGVHSGRSRSYAWASVITQEDMKHAARSVGWEHELHVDVESQDLHLEPTDLPPFADNITVLGATHQGARLPTRNPIEPSSIAHEMAKRYSIYPKTLPTQMRPFVPKQLSEAFVNKGWLKEISSSNTDQVSPLGLGQAKMSVPGYFIPLKIVAEVAKAWGQQLPKPSVLRVLHPRDVINGNAFLDEDAIAHDTSVGWPMKNREGLKTRKEIFGRNEEEWKPEFVEAVRKIYDVNSTESFYKPCYTDSLKIERDEINKIMEGKTRIFFGGELAFLVYGTSIGGDITNFFKRRCTGSICPGINPHSSDWGELWRRLCKHPNFIATDAKNWDLSQQAQLVWGITLLWTQWSSGIPIQNLAPEFFKNVEQYPIHLEKAIRGCSESIHVINNLIYEMWKSWMSGNWATSFGNCSLNGLAWRIVFVVLALENKVVFSMPLMQAYAEFVEDAFYGDDCVLSVSDYISSWFNQFTVAKKFKEMFGITLTDSSKNEITRAFIPRDEVTFLSRHFVSRDGFIWAPLKKDIIYEMCLWVTDKAQKPSFTSQTLTSAMQEAVHHGRAFYDELFDILSACSAGRCAFRPLDYEVVVQSVMHG